MQSASITENIAWQNMLVLILMKSCKYSLFSSYYGQPFVLSVEYHGEELIQKSSFGNVLRCHASQG